MMLVQVLEKKIDVPWAIAHEIRRINVILQQMNIGFKELICLPI